jgi:hypothetical protein
MGLPARWGCGRLTRGDKIAFNATRRPQLSINVRGWLQRVTMRNSRLSRRALFDVFRSTALSDKVEPRLPVAFSLETFYRARSREIANPFPVVRRRNGLPAVPTATTGLTKKSPHE